MDANSKEVLLWQAKTKYLRSVGLNMEAQEHAEQYHPTVDYVF